jgi:hypothetical protein
MTRKARADQSCKLAEAKLIIFGALALDHKMRGLPESLINRLLTGYVNTEEFLKTGRMLVWPCVETLASDLGVDRRSVQRARQTACERGYLVQRTPGGGAGNANLYELLKGGVGAAEKGGVHAAEKGGVAVQKGRRGRRPTYFEDSEGALTEPPSEEGEREMVELALDLASPPGALAPLEGRAPEEDQGKEVDAMEEDAGGEPPEEEKRVAEEPKKTKWAAACSTKTPTNSRSIGKPGRPGKGNHAHSMVLKQGSTNADHRHDITVMARGTSAAQLKTHDDVMGLAFAELRALWQRDWLSDDEPRAVAAQRRAYRAAIQGGATHDEIMDGARAWVAAADKPRFLVKLVDFLTVEGWTKPPPAKPKRAGAARYNGYAGHRPAYSGNRAKPDLAELCLLHGGAYRKDEDGRLVKVAS